VDIAIAGQRVDTGEAFRHHVSDALNAIRIKYFERALRASVTLTPGPRGSGFVAEVSMHVMADVLLKASGQAAVAQLAFDQAAERLEKQLRRYVRRLRHRQHAPGDRSNGMASAAAPAGPAPAIEAAYTLFEAPEDHDDDQAHAGEAPPVIAEWAVDVPTASVAQAVEMLDLRNTTALLFRNAASGGFNMVYRRGDGSIGWVEPRRT
jgi:ribosomal subunit interface protein